MSDPRRRDAIVAVQAIDPVDAREAGAKAEVLRGLRLLDRPFDEHAAPTHVTASGLVVSDRGIVLLRHKRLGLWLQPGGHVDGAEIPADAAVREACEETGLPVRHRFDVPVLLHVDAHDGGRGHRHLDLRYVLTAPEADPSPPVGESPACRWFRWSEAVRIADAGLRGVLDRLRDVHSQAELPPLPSS